MNIEKLEIKGFGKLSNVTLELCKGMNIVLGDNEAGKTTLQWFIKAMLFGLKGGKASKDGTLPPLKRYKPWNEGDYAGFMEYRLDDGYLYRVGRNFGTGSVRIFDSLFNDITSTFDSSREKGALFAEKHLGLNEACFDKTVFIRQMETKIGEDGSKELHNRIMNISETGFEDISFKRAQETLKDALKNYVGTDKTSTRPLDKVVNRLTELKVRREELINKRNSVFSIENELNNTITVKSNLEERKAFLEKIKDLVELKSRVDKNKQLRAEIEDIFDSINKDEEELKIIEERIEEFNKEKEELAGYSIFDHEDIEVIDRQYQKFLDKVKENKELKIEMKDKEREIDKSRRDIEPILGFGELGDSIESKVAELNKDIEYLKKDYEKNNLEVLTEKIGIAEQRVKSYKRWFLVSAATALIFLCVGFTVQYLGLGVAFAAFITAIVLFYFRRKGLKDLNALFDEKKMSFVNINSMVEEMKKKQGYLTGIFDKVGANSLDNFLELKAVYDTKSTFIAALNSDISRLESEYAINMREISVLKGQIISKLIEAELLSYETLEFDEEHIKRFKNGVRRYKGIDPSMNYTAQKLEDVNKSIQKNYKRAVLIIGEDFDKKEALYDKIKQIDEELQELEKALATGIDQMRVCLDEEFKTKSLDEIACGSGISDMVFLKSNIFKTCSNFEEEYNRINEELKTVLLNIREFETLLKGVSGDEAELRKVEEEIEEMEAKKSQLEDINISLKTALDVLNEASEEIKKDFVPVLNYRMTDAVKRITGGKYSDLRADSTLSLKVIAPETGDVVGVSSLSGGTVDQMYLALRISAADMIGDKGEKIPFIMDEIFAQYDDIRTKETFSYLKEISKQRQIIFFTCKGREMEIAKQVFDSNINILKLA